MTDDQKEQIAIEVIIVIKNLFDILPIGELEILLTPFHQGFLNVNPEILKKQHQEIADGFNSYKWLHGLNTSLGQSFLEKTAHILCNGEKKEFTTNKNTSLKISRNQKNLINTLITDLTNGRRMPNLQKEYDEFFTDTNLEIEATDFTVDVYFEDDEQIVCIELKTVKPNKGVFKVEKEKVLEAKIALQNYHPNKKIYYFLGFPFDPLSTTPTGFNKQRFMDYSVGFSKFFSLDEFLLSTELWDFLSGKPNTMEDILDIINTIAKPNFLDIFNFINDFTNVTKNSSQFLLYLGNWYLKTDWEIVKNYDNLKILSENDRQLQRLLYQNLFDNSNKYRFDRSQILSNKI